MHLGRVMYIGQCRQLHMCTKAAAHFLCYESEAAPLSLSAPHGSVSVDFLFCALTVEPKAADSKKFKVVLWKRRDLGDIKIGRVCDGIVDRSLLIIW